ncbi:YY1-associated factor 2 [Aphelenchoides besseyi]|nr:YY1-associated factor 2 [Aphelenchoides besseyi]
MSGRRGRNRRSSSQDDESPEPEIKRTKRVSQQPSTSQEAVDSDDYEPGSWECSVCTFRNRYEAFKCEMCESRKGTSTRKPRLNQTVVIQQQALAHSLVAQQNQQQSSQQMLTTTTSTKRPRNADSRSRFSPGSNDSSSPASVRTARKLLKPKKEKDRPPVSLPDSLVIRSSFKKHTITVDGMTVIITEFEQRKPIGGKRTQLDGQLKRPKKEELN